MYHLIFLLGQLVSAEVTVEDNSQTAALDHQELLAHVSIVHGIAHQHSDIALGNALNGLGIASEHIQSLVVQNEIISTGSQTLLDADQLSACELAVVTHIVQILTG